MSKSVNKILFAFIFIIVFSTCDSDEKKFKKKTRYFFSHNDHSLSDEVLKKAKDTLVGWSEASLLYSFYNSELYNDTWTIDSVICFNKLGNKAIFQILKKNKEKEAVSDMIPYMLAEKLKENTWYFFYGATMYIPREYYTQDIHTPLTFEKLAEIGRKQLLGGYYYKPWPWSSKYEINDELFKNEFEIAITEKQKWEFIGRVGRHKK